MLVISDTARIATVAETERFRVCRIFIRSSVGSLVTHAEIPRNTADSIARGRRLILAELTVQGIESGALL